jgi:transposase InsO family protein
MDAPPAAVGDPADLLHIDVDHVPGIAGGDHARGAVVLSVGVQVAAPVEAQAGQPAPDRGPTDRDAVSGQLAGDQPGGPLLLPPQRLDPGHHRARGLGRAGMRGAGPVDQPALAQGGGAGVPLDRQRWNTREELRPAIITWIERTYHRRRRQRRLGRLTPIEYERLNLAATAAYHPTRRVNRTRGSPEIGCPAPITGNYLGNRR